MTETIMEIIQWAIPSGGIGAAIAWIMNRKAAAAKEAKSVHDTYKLMYEDVSRELLATQQKMDSYRVMYEDINKELLTTQQKVDESTKAIDESKKTMESLARENKRTRNALNRLSRAIEAIKRCPYSDTCPINDELQGVEDDGSDENRQVYGSRGTKGQHHKRDECTKSNVDGSSEG